MNNSRGMDHEVGDIISHNGRTGIVVESDKGKWTVLWVQKGENKYCVNTGLVEMDLERSHRIGRISEKVSQAAESEIELLRAAHEQHRERICKAANAADDLVEKTRDLDAMVRLLVNQPEILDEDFGTHVKAFAQEVFVDAGLLRGRLH